MSTIDYALQKELMDFVAAEEQNENPKPSRASVTAELLKQVANGEREITGVATNEETGDVLVRFSITLARGSGPKEDELETINPDEYGKHIIWRDDSESVVHISTGFERCHYPLHKLTWNNDKGTEEAADTGDWLTLNEIRDQIYKKHSGRTIIEVRVENPMEGVIYQVGNYQDGIWRKHGTTMGYA